MEQILDKLRLSLDNCENWKRKKDITQLNLVPIVQAGIRTTLN